MASMGKSIPSASKLQQVASTLSYSRKPRHNKKPLPATVVPFRHSETGTEPGKLKKMEGTSFSVDGQKKVPLALVVADCVNRWFHDTLKDAKDGDVAMQVLVAQMYYNGYGVPKDAVKGQAWINRASKGRPSAWKVSGKRPGYNASDSDSDSDSDIGGVDKS